jgi:hypothetical protein
VVKNASPVSTSTPVPLDFVLVETSTSLDNLETEKQLLNDMIITGLRETQVFGSVSGDKADAGSGGGIKVYADIKEIKKVSRSARVWVGALAGRARILVQVTVSDLNSGNQIQTFEVEGISGGSARAGTTDEAIQRAAQRVVAEMVKVSRQTSQ